ncbi:MAG: carbamoyltransferase [Bradyrhizobium sp.]|jgi:carbamoyltransferase|nr:carbamoyltransferase [Bradyrhizobium sp.]
MNTVVPEYHLGISAYYHDSAAALVRDGIPVAAAQQERFSRKRYDSSFPGEAVRYCLRRAGIGLDDLHSVVYYEQPDVKFRRIVSSFASAGPCAAGFFSSAAPDWLFRKRKTLDQVGRELEKLDMGHAPDVVACPHHRSHAASAFYASPFDHAAVLCVDGVGEWHTTTIWRGRGADLELINSISFPHSLGLLYSAFTYYCGFKVDSGEYKLMGLAPYGRPVYEDLIRRELINLRDDGSFTINLDYFEFLRGERMIGDRFAELFRAPRRQPEAPLRQHDCDVAASIQKVTDGAIVRLALVARDLTGEDRLCMAGGVALNCVSNGHISRAGVFSRLWVQPAAGDAGGALGAALDSSVRSNGRRACRRGDLMSGSLLGPEYEDDAIARFLDAAGHSYRRLPEAELLEEVSTALARGAVVGWFQGRMEFGPRALGSRSILGDPRNAEMQKTMNLKIKFRESFRPFAPSVLEEDAATYFDLREESPYMLVVSPVREELRVENRVNRSLGAINDVRSTLPAVTHVDMSARVQTVETATSGRYGRLLLKFKEKTGCSVLVNTSFNVRGEPIVCTPEEAYRCFLRTQIDLLALGSCVLRKSDQRPLEDDVNWRSEIPVD